MKTTQISTGREVYILALDSDPQALVWVSYLDNPDQDAMVPRSDLEEC